MLAGIFCKGLSGAGAMFVMNEVTLIRVVGDAALNTNNGVSLKLNLSEHQQRRKYL